MYNRLFSKILDSSVWLEPDHTRIVWITLLAAMDEDGYAHFSAPQNLANRAGVTLKNTEKAILTLESPDDNSHDKDNEGRRIERVDGGWMVLNAQKYRALASREAAKEWNRLRIREFRAKKKKACTEADTDTDTGVTVSNETVRTQPLQGVTPVRRNIEEFLLKIRAIGFRDSKAIAVEHAMVDVCAEGTKPEDLYAALLRIYKWTGNGAYAPRLHEAIHRWQEPEHLWNPPKRKEAHLEIPAREDYGETECPVCGKTPCGTFKDCQAEGKRRGWL